MCYGNVWVCFLCTLVRLPVLYSIFELYCIVYGTLDTIYGVHVHADVYAIAQDQSILHRAAIVDCRRELLDGRLQSTKACKAN